MSINYSGSAHRSFKKIDLSQIVKDGNAKSAISGLITTNKRAVKERDNSPSFVDFEDVPPLM